MISLLSPSVIFSYHFIVIRVHCEIMCLPDDLFYTFVTEHIQKLLIDIYMPVTLHYGYAIIGMLNGYPEVVIGSCWFAFADKVIFSHGNGSIIYTLFSDMIPMENSKTTSRPGSAKKVFKTVLFTSA